MSEPIPVKVRARLEPIIRVRHLNHSFGEGENLTRILDDINLEIFPGEIVIMTGPSGSGKTTLLTLLGALRTVQEGSMEIMSRQISSLSAEQLVDVRRNIGFIFQAHNLFKSLTAVQNVRMALELKHNNHAYIQERAVECLTMLGLEHRLNHKPEQMSGGQKQRVAVARAIANKPRLILADEPTAALDEQMSRIVVNILRSMADRERTTCLVVTHDNRIIDVADRLVNMVDGRIKSNVLAKQITEICEFLSQSEFFKSLTSSGLSSIAEKMATEAFATGSTIIRQGDVGDKFYLIKEGTVDVTIEQSDGTHLKVATLKRGQFFGERAVLTNEPRNATVKAIEYVETYTLGKEDFRAALSSSDSVAREIRKVLFSRQ